MNAEEDYMNVIVAVDFFQLNRFARYHGTNVYFLLEIIQSYGINTVALIEDTPEFLEERGLAAVVKGFNVEEKVLQ